jgi:hypothetical protein
LIAVTLAHDKMAARPYCERPTASGNVIQVGGCVELLADAIHVGSKRAGRGCGGKDGVYAAHAMARANPAQQPHSHSAHCFVLGQ